MTIASPSSAGSYVDLEMSLHRIAAGDDEVELRTFDPLSDAAMPPVRGAAALDRQELLPLEQDSRAYGEKLAAQVFATPQVRNYFLMTRRAAESSGRLLRLRLLIGSSAPDLHGLRWELLRDPETGEQLSTSERVLFSRFQVSQDWRPVKLRRKAELRALVAVAAPSDCATYKLAEVDRGGEIARARKGLGGLPTTVLGEAEPVTLDGLAAALREGVDVLYLVCHGALVRGQPWLFLQDKEGKADRVAGAALTERLREISDPPRLVVLASCESGGTAEGATQAALAPRLADSGVTAVVAMQGQVSMETVETAMPAFFSELGRDGLIDRALAVARGTVRKRPDAWMPVLYLRLKSGRIWYEPGFADEPRSKEGIKRWRSIASHVQEGCCVPILGPDLGEHLFGSARERADRLAEKHGFPLEPHDRSDLAKVAQYLTVTQDNRYARRAIVEQLKDEIRRRHPGLAGEPRIFEAAARRALGQADGGDPFAILAALKVPLYVTASPDLVLLFALEAAGRKPAPLFYRWRKTPESHPVQPEYTGMPGRETPVVYYPFGISRKGEEDSLVLTEDDFLDYLITAAKEKLIPAVVSGTVVKSALLFLGFTLDDLAFRVLFRLIMSLEGSSQLGDYAHVGVQIDPEAHSLVDVERAREYLEEYFGTGRDAPRIDLYWGTAADFLKELREHLQDAAAAPKPEETEDEWISV